MENENNADFAVKNSIDENTDNRIIDPYDGMVKRPDDDGYWTVEEAVEFFEIPTLIDRVDDWAICEDGIYSLLIEYIVHRDRIDESDWVEHMQEKSWVNIAVFKSAMERARQVWNGQ